MPKALMLFKIKGDKSSLINLFEKGTIRQLLPNLYKYYLESKEGFKARIVKNWMNNVKDERISSEGVKYPGNSLELLLEYGYMFKYPSSLGSMRSLRSITIPVSHFVWIRRNSPLLVFFDVFKRGLIKVIVESLSLLAYHKTDVIVPLSLSFEDFESIEAWLKGKEGRNVGFIKRVIFADSVIENSHVDEISVKRVALENEPIYKSVKESSRKWLSITFVTPLVEEIGTRLSCRLSHDGSLIIYSLIQNLLVIDMFLTKLEHILALIQ